MYVLRALFQAYRLEPLVNPLYSKVHPLRIHRHDSKCHTPYNEMPLELMNCLKSPAKEKSTVENVPAKKKSTNENKKLAHVVELATMAHNDTPMEDDGVDAGEGKDSIYS